MLSMTPRKLPYLLSALLLVLLVALLLVRPQTVIDTSIPWPSITTVFHSDHDPPTDPSPRIARLSISFGEPDNPLWQRLLALQTRHARRHAYPMYILRRELLPAYWSKPAWLLSVMLAECAKPPDDRLDWLLYSDSDVLVTNPAMPLEAFLPPSPEFDDIQLLIAEDMAHPELTAVTPHDHRLMINAGAYLIRVGPWGLQFLADVIAYESYTGDRHPGSAANYKYDQSAMKHVMEMDKNAHAWQLVPQRWFNAYPGPGDTPRDGTDPAHWRTGDLQAHFPGEFKPALMPWLNHVEAHYDEMDVSFERTAWPGSIQVFWAEARRRREAGEYDVLTTPRAPDRRVKSAEVVRERRAAGHA